MGNEHRNHRTFTDISIPPRYGTNSKGALPADRGAAFQFLQGTVQTVIRAFRVHLNIDISIPPRYGTNGLMARKSKC